MANQRISEHMGVEPGGYQKSEPSTFLEDDIANVAEAFKQTTLCGSSLEHEELGAWRQMPGGSVHKKPAYCATSEPQKWQPQKWQPQIRQPQKPDADPCRDGSTSGPWYPRSSGDTGYSGGSTSDPGGHTLSPAVEEMVCTASRQHFRSKLRKTQWCRYLQRGCLRGDQCDFAHTLEELKSPPDLSKTAICKLWALGFCPKPQTECPFAHGPNDLRPVRKWTMFQRFAHGRCSRSEDCCYAHWADECRVPNSTVDRLLNDTAETTDTGHWTGLMTMSC